MADLDLFQREEMEAWLQSPPTRKFLAFLRSEQSKLGLRWQTGEEMSLQQQTKALLLGELASLNWADYALATGLDDSQGAL